MKAFDDRIVRVGIEIDGDITVLEGLDIRATGMKFGSSVCESCTIQISNLTNDQRQFILTKATPNFNNANRKSINIYLDVGRESYGVFRLFEGPCLATGATQPPDVGIVLQALNNSASAADVGITSLGPKEKLSTIAQRVADQNGLTLVLDPKVKETDKLIDNYSFSGALSKQVIKLAQAGNLDVFVDGKQLHVMDRKSFRAGGTLLISEATGMVGIPQACENGVNIQTLILPSIALAGAVNVQSKFNPGVNGIYKVMQIAYTVTNRDDPFWYSLYCSNSDAALVAKQ